MLEGRGGRWLNLLLNFQKGRGLDRTSVFRGGCLKREGWLFSGGGVAVFRWKDELKPGIFNHKKKFKRRMLCSLITKNSNWEILRIYLHLKDQMGWRWKALKFWGFTEKSECFWGVGWYPNVHYGRYYFGICSSELAQLVGFPYPLRRSTGYSDRLHDFSVTIPRCYKDVYVNSFFPLMARLWNFAYILVSFDLQSKWLEV